VNTATILMATNNPGKQRELAALLAAYPVRPVRPSELGITLEVDEDGQTYAENARRKAIAFARASGLIALADDSGLEIAVLDGWPGPRSARWAGPAATDADRRALVLARLAGVPDRDRRARFVCHAVLADPHGILAEAEGTLAGRIATSEQGQGGFGYDAIFVPDGYPCTLASLPEEVKNRLSHRAQAISRLRDVLLRLACPDSAPSS